MQIIATTPHTDNPPNVPASQPIRFEENIRIMDESVITLHICYFLSQTFKWIWTSEEWRCSDYFSLESWTFAV